MGVRRRHAFEISLADLVQRPSPRQTPGVQVNIVADQGLPHLSCRTARQARYLSQGQQIAVSPSQVIGNLPDIAGHHGLKQRSARGDLTARWGCQGVQHLHPAQGLTRREPPQDGALAAIGDHRRCELQLSQARAAGRNHLLAQQARGRDILPRPPHHPNFVHVLQWPDAGGGHAQPDVHLLGGVEGTGRAQHLSGLDVLGRNPAQINRHPAPGLRHIDALPTPLDPPQADLAP